MSVRTSHLKARLDLKDLLPKWPTHLAVGRKPRFLATWASVGPLDYPYDMAAGFPRVDDPRERQRQRGGSQPLLLS